MPRMPHFGLGQAPPTEGPAPVPTYTAPDPNADAGFMGLTNGQALALTYSQWLSYQQQMTPNPQFWNTTTWLAERCGWLGLPTTALATAAANAPGGVPSDSDAAAMISAAPPASTMISPAAASSVMRSITIMRAPLATQAPTAVPQTQTVAIQQAPAAAPSWWEETTSILGLTLENWMLAVAAAVIGVGAYAYSRGKK